MDALRLLAGKKDEACLDPLCEVTSPLMAIRWLDEHGMAFDWAVLHHPDDAEPGVKLHRISEYTGTGDEKRERWVVDSTSADQPASTH
jgi:hypothetical protein